MKKYYRVVESSTNIKKEYDTSITSYGDGFDAVNYHHFMKVYGDTMAQINLPVDFLISVSNQIYMNGEIYLNLLNNSIDEKGLLHLYKVTMNHKHQGFTIPVDLMFEFLQGFDEENQFIFFDNGIILWEYYLEKVRNEEFSHLPPRLKSAFFFDDIDKCNDYNKVHLSGLGSTFEVDVLENKSMFAGDMRIIDELDNSISRDKLLEQIRKYWLGGKTENPMMEIVFQGRYELIEI